VQVVEAVAQTEQFSEHFEHSPKSRK